MRTILKNYDGQIQLRNVGIALVLRSDFWLSI